MKSMIKLIGIIALAAIIGFGVIGCDSEAKSTPSSVDLFMGTWEMSDGGNQIVAANGAFTQSQDMGSGMKPFFKGTYKVSGNTVTITFTQIDQTQSGNWVSYTGLEDPNFPPTTVVGTISGNTLTVSVNGEPYIFTKQTGGSGPSESGGLFILTGIPQEYWGKYAVLHGDKIMLIGGASLEVATQDITGVLISNGSVSLPMWRIFSETSVDRYSGNDTDNFSLVIFSGSPIYSGTEEIEVLFQAVTFSNGGAARTWDDRVNPGQGDSLVGTWLPDSNPKTWTFRSDGTYEVYESARGNYFTDEDTLTMTITEYHGSGFTTGTIPHIWYTSNQQLYDALSSYFYTSFMQAGQSQETAVSMASSFAGQTADQLFAAAPQVTYFVDGNTLTLTSVNSEGTPTVSTLTRQP